MTLDLYSLRARLGGTVYSNGRRWLGPGPGHSPADQSLSVFITDDGTPLVKSFANDPYPACADYLGLEKRGDTPRADQRDKEARRQQQAAEAERRTARALAFCREMWRGVVPVDGTPAETYLRSRGLVGPWPRNLRFHPAARTSYEHPGQRPALVGRVSSSQGVSKGLHVTPLRPDGLGKAAGFRSRLMFGPVNGASVQLAPFCDELAVAEGVETALSFTTQHGVPCWATLSTSGLQNFILPVGVKRLVIAADNDDKGAGIAAARKLAERARTSCEVVILPAPEGMDWNDALREVVE